MQPLEGSGKPIIYIWHMVAKGYFLFILLDFTETMFKLHGSFLHYSLISVVTFTCSDPNYIIQQFGSQRPSISTFFPHPSVPEIQSFTIT